MFNEWCGDFSLHLKAYAAPSEPATLSLRTKSGLVVHAFASAPLHKNIFLSVY